MPEKTFRSSFESLARQLGGGAAGAVEKVVEAVPGSGSAGALLEQLGEVLPGGGPLEALGGQLKRPEQLARAARVLFEAGIIRVDRPDTLVRAARTLLEQRLTPAAAFVVAAMRFPDEPAIVDEIGSLTFSEVDRRTNALARAMAEAEVGADDSVAIMCRDHRWFIEATVAISKLGATVLLYNTAFPGPQLKEVTEREDPAAIVYDEEFAEAIEEATGDRQRWVAWHDGVAENGDIDDNSVERLIEQTDDSDLPTPDRPGKITLLTSGSTGTPKGASRGEPDPVDPIVAVLSRIPLRAREPSFFAAPLFHAWGFMQFNLGMLLSSTYVLRRKFDPEATLAKIEETNATGLVIVPVMLQRILELDEDTRQRFDLSSLRVVASSGGALSADLAQEWMDTFGDNLYNLYGSTEVAYAAIATPEDLRAAPGTSGPAPPGTSLRILDEESKEAKPPGETGQIFVGNQLLFEGYTGDEESDEMVDGHMTTGDLGHLDEEGRLFVEGRADNMIVSGGENVYPEEVEEALEKHEQVSQAAVIGVEDEEFGERLKAFVVKDGEVSEDDLKSHVKTNLARYKVPREIEFVEELPRKPQGKVDKKKLEEDEEAQSDSSDGDSDRDGRKSGDRG
jgi:acyl-CoA synthetase (AMP-forming)/AMP-acid ligase II